MSGLLLAVNIKTRVCKSFTVHWYRTFNPDPTLVLPLAGCWGGRYLAPQHSCFIKCCLIPAHKARSALERHLSLQHFLRYYEVLQLHRL